MTVTSELSNQKHRKKTVASASSRCYEIFLTQIFYQIYNSTLNIHSSALFFSGGMSDLTEQVYCLIRKTWVAAQPEELVRQRLLSHMIHNLGFPPSYLVLEKELRQMPHLEANSQQIPDRRADLICFGKDIHPKFPLYPLLLVECKAIKLSSKVIDQVVGYNHSMQAYFVAIANGQEIKTGWYDKEKKEYTFVNDLPRYTELLGAICS